MTRTEIIELIIAERIRHFNLPGSEWDVNNEPNDWIAIAASYLTQNVKKKNARPSQQDYIDNLIKAAAVILASLENADNMNKNNSFMS